MPSLKTLQGSTQISPPSCACVCVRTHAPFFSVCSWKVLRKQSIETCRIPAEKQMEAMAGA